MAVHVRSKFVIVDLTNDCGSCKEELTSRIHHVHIKLIDVTLLQKCKVFCLI
uniref:Uncharacterized protein n=1 Tax=Oryza brachyantha TaxID=4533 RepID=J3N2M8_ORYBR